jgi:hypothetical protein
MSDLIGVFTVSSDLCIYAGVHTQQPDRFRMFHVVYKGTEYYSSAIDRQFCKNNNKFGIHIRDLDGLIRSGEITEISVRNLKYTKSRNIEFDIVVAHKELSELTMPVLAERVAL